VIAYLIVIVLTRYVARVNYSMLHAGAAVSAVLGALMVMMRKGTATAAARRKMDFNKKYMSYYTLTTLSGARRHVTMTFAGFLLVQTYRTPVFTMVLLACLSSLVAIFTRPAIGRLIDRWGEQRSLMVNYLIVIPIFLCYAFVKWPLFLFFAYILDNATSGFDVAIQTHMGKIAPPDALSNAYAMGSTMTHITGVGVPILGGFLWDAAGAPAVFLMGTCFAGYALWFSQQLDRIERNLKTTSVAA
jgi:MFS family permease